MGINIIFCVLYKNKLITVMFLITYLKHNVYYLIYNIYVFIYKSVFYYHRLILKYIFVTFYTIIIFL